MQSFTSGNKNYNYLEEHEIPKLFIGMIDNEYNPIIKPEYNPIKLNHQTSGYACGQLNLYGLLFNLNDFGSKFYKELNNSYLESCIGLGNDSLNDIIKYRILINKYNFDCNISYKYFSEAVYPLDLTENWINEIKLISNIDLPNELNDICKFNSPIQKMIGCVGRWNCFILGENCD